MAARRWALDLGPLRTSRDFRIFLGTQTVSYFGTFITYVALPLQVARLTSSPLAVGLIGLCELSSLLVTALLGGALADFVDRRRLMIAGQVGSLLTCAVLLLNVVGGNPQVWVLYAIATVSSAVDGLRRPAVEGLIQRIVPMSQQAAAAALRSLTMQGAALAGPAVGGVLIAAYGFAWAYGIELGTLVLSLAGMLLIRATPPPPDADRPSLRSIGIGLRYAWNRPELMGTYVVDIVAMFFGMPMALFPFVADRLGGPSILGLLYAAPSVGAVIATLTSGWTGRVRRHGLGVIWAATVWGVAIVVFGLCYEAASGGALAGAFGGALSGSTARWAALAALALAGGADMISGVFRQVIWNQTIPDRLRGRLAGVEMLSYMTGPLLGNVESGLVARPLGVGGSIVSGGVACVVGVAALAVGLPAFRRYDAREGLARREADEAAWAAEAAAGSAGSGLAGSAAPAAP